MKCEVQIASLGDFRGVFKSFLTAGKQLPQFLFAFEIELFRLKAHTVFVVHGLTGLDAQQYILHFCIFPTQIVGVIGDHQRKSRFSGKPLQPLIYRTLGIDSVILQLQIKMIRSEDPAELQRVFFR